MLFLPGGTWEKCNKIAFLTLWTEDWSLLVTEFQSSLGIPIDPTVSSIAHDVTRSSNYYRSCVTGPTLLNVSKPDSSVNYYATGRADGQRQPAQ